MNNQNRKTKSWLSENCKFAAIITPTIEKLADKLIKAKSYIKHILKQFDNINNYQESGNNKVFFDVNYFNFTLEINDSTDGFEIKIQAYNHPPNGNNARSPIIVDTIYINNNDSNNKQADEMDKLTSIVDDVSKLENKTQHLSICIPIVKSFLSEYPFQFGEPTLNVNHLQIPISIYGWNGTIDISSFTLNIFTASITLKDPKSTWFTKYMSISVHGNEIYNIQNELKKLNSVVSHINPQFSKESQPEHALPLLIVKNIPTTSKIASQSFDHDSGSIVIESQIDQKNNYFNSSHILIHSKISFSHMQNQFGTQIKITQLTASILQNKEPLAEIQLIQDSSGLLDFNPIDEVSIPVCELLNHLILTLRNLFSLPISTRKIKNIISDSTTLDELEQNYKIEEERQKDSPIKGKQTE